MEQLLTVEEVADLLKVRPRWVYDQVERRALPYVKVGRYVRFRVSELEAYLAEHAIVPGAPAPRRRPRPAPPPAAPALVGGYQQYRVTLADLTGGPPSAAAARSPAPAAPSRPQ
jgi:excisionase family DNA binding protein